MKTDRSNWYDPRESWAPVVAVFVLALALVVDLVRPGGVLGGGLWIPFLYAVVPVAIGLLTFVRTRAATGRTIPRMALVGMGVWGVLGALASLVVLIILGLGRPRPTIPSTAAFGLVVGLITYLVPTGVFAGFYGEAGRRPKLIAVALVAAAPLVETLLFVAFALSLY